MPQTFGALYLFISAEFPTTDSRKQITHSNQPHQLGTDIWHALRFKFDGSFLQISAEMRCVLRKSILKYKILRCMFIRYYAKPLSG